MTVTITGIHVTAFLVGLFLLLLAIEIRRKHLAIWIGSYWSQQSHSDVTVRAPGEVTDIMFCLVDHFEPLSGPTKEIEQERMRTWRDEDPKLASRHKDSDGKPPQHSWFYPGERYEAECLERLAELAKQGYGEIELHLHHGYDSPERLQRQLEAAVRNFAQHGALVTESGGTRQFAYAFIHGNMGLNNSMGIGACGVPAELPILRKTGCYADFSMPTAPGRSQTKKINAIYYAQDIPSRDKSHDDGIDVRVGRPPSGDLMIVQGPLGINWSSRKYGIIPRVENGEIQESNPPTAARIRLWVKQHIHVKGRPNWIFVKVSCHGAEDRSRDVILGRQADQMYTYLEREYRDGSGYRLHYVTAREVYNIVKAAEAGMDGDPHQYRDYVIPRYRTHS